MGSMKAPEPDGLNGQFYHYHWKDIKQGIFTEVRDIFSSELLNPELNKTHLSLIPKVRNWESFDQFGPISLCNFACKIISKVLANRLKPWLPNIIGDEQTAFVRGRQI